MLKNALDAHKQWKGKIEIKPTCPLANRDDLAVAYTPGVAEPCLEIAKDSKLAYDYTRKWNTVAVVSDGSAVLGLGNIGGIAGLPVMEGKAVLFKAFADIDAIPIVLSTQNVDEIVLTVKAIAPSFGGINLEDISAPRCFEVERRLKEELDIPVFHDDQHGTAVVVLAALTNSLKLVGKKIEDIKIVICGAGSAGNAICRLLLKAGANNVLMVGRNGILNKDTPNLDSGKAELVKITNKNDEHGSLQDALCGADVFVGVSSKNLINADDVKTMNKDAIVFALANPSPEILPDEAKKGGARVVATGRSDFDNQINNVLVFPGIFRGALDSRKSKITDNMKLAAAKAIASLVSDEELCDSFVIPNAFDKRVASVVAKAVAETD